MYQFKLRKTASDFQIVSWINVIGVVKLGNIMSFLINHVLQLEVNCLVKLIKQTCPTCQPATLNSINVIKLLIMGMWDYFNVIL